MTSRLQKPDSCLTEGVNLSGKQTDWAMGLI